MRTTKFFAIAAALILSIAACTDKPSYEAKYPTNKLAPNDPFAETMVESEFFDIEPKQDNIVEGAHGTVVFIPEGALLDKNGNPAKGPVKVEITEALGVEDMVLSNLTTTADGKLLQSGGMLYINATANGEQLHIDTTKPLHIEMPSDVKIAGMMAYRGIRDSAGNMNWVDPKPLINYLTAVDLADLDFLQPGFYDEVAAGMPYRGHLTADRNLADSLYYSLRVDDGSHLTQGVKNTKMNEAQYNLNKKIEKGKYTDKSFDIQIGGTMDAILQSTPSLDTAKSIQIADSTGWVCGINPASIKVIKGKKFENTYIATREFEARMKFIHQSCDQAILEIYVNNLDKNLWEADKMVVDYLSKWTTEGSGGEHPLLKEFERFYQLKQTKVKDSDKAAEKLAEYYKKQLQKTEGALQRLKDKEVKKLEKENQKFEEVKADYREVLWKREKYRNEKYGWEWTDLGWVNIDKPIGDGPYIYIEKTCFGSKVEVQLNDATQYERAYMYLLIPSIKSMYRLNSNDYKNFYAGNTSVKEVHLPCNENITIITVAYKGKLAYFGAGSFIAGQQTNFPFPGKMSAASDKELKQLLKKYNNDYIAANSIEKDLVFQEKLYKEELRQKVLKSEQEFINRLFYSVFGNCCVFAVPQEGKQPNTIEDIESD